ncbi:hypothetical protein AB1Y20_017251 [Prymnesium parvum]|uniref:Glycosyl transferase family 25 domain-containing protein n=1 Tax=Prymnesium parvum TaxID=97485 RepID=A0AB34JNM9_PRYPA
MNRLLVAASLAAVAFAAHRYLSRRRRRLPAASRLPTYVISLARRPARRRAALERLRVAGLEDLKCFDAIDGRELCVDALQARGVEVYSGWRLSASACRFFNRSLKWGEVGCALSHHAVWELAAASEDEAVLVLEDDVELLPGFCELLQETVLEVEALVQQGATSEPDLLYLTRRAMKPGDDVPVGDRGRARGGRNTRIRLVTPGFSYKTTAYILYKRGAQKLLQSGFLRKVIPVDDFLNVLFTTHEVEPGLARPDLDLLFADAPRLNVLAVKPQLARERRGISDTENSTELVQ